VDTAKCNKTWKVHEGEHPQKFKARTQQPFREVKMFITLGKESDSHGKHFPSQFLNSTLFPDAECEGIVCSIIWQDKPHQCGLNICNNKLHGAHARRNCNSKTMNLQISSMTGI